MAVKKLGVAAETDEAAELNLALEHSRAKPKSMPTAADRKRQEALSDYLDWYESSFGPIPEEELLAVDALWPA